MSLYCYFNYYYNFFHVNAHFTWCCCTSFHSIFTRISYVFRYYSFCCEHLFDVVSVDQAVDPDAYWTQFIAEHCFQTFWVMIDFFRIFCVLTARHVIVGIIVMSFLCKSRKRNTCDCIQVYLCHLVYNLYRLFEFCSRHSKRSAESVLLQLLVIISLQS